MGLVAAALAALYRVRCAGCGRRGPERLCAACVAAWPSVAPLPGVSAAGAMAGPARRAIHQLKYHGKRRLAPLLAARVLPALPPGPWLVVPVPLHPRRRRQRGYNQAALLARALARLGRWRYLDALGRVKETTPSPGLGKQARQENLLGAFQARARVDGLRVLLVDDVMTSGATAVACVAVLLAAGAAEVHVAVVARKP